MTPRRRAAIIGLGGLLLALTAASSASADPPTPGGCQAFGQNVAGLATTLGATFGATASGVASSGPAVFPNAVVHPEQAAFCSG